MYLKELQKLRNQTWDKNTIPLVSIACTTYNHQSYIEKCLNSFLDQKTTFPVEIIIHDDASGDDTQKLISNFEPKYPQLFKKILQTDNQYSQGVKPFYKFIFPIVRGEYIAFCEGDDYWTDPLKLQRQVEFLESNHECSMCCTNYTEVNESGKVVNKYGWGKEKRNTRITNLMVLQYYTPKFLTSIIRQKALTVDLFHEIQKVPNGDNFLFAAVTKKGPAAYLDFVSGAYRINDNGVWGKKSELEQKKMQLQTFTVMKGVFQNDDQQLAINKRIGRINKFLSREYAKRKMYKEAYITYLKAFVHLRGKLKSFFILNKIILESALEEVIKRNRL